MRNPFKTDQSGGCRKRYRNRHQLGGAASRRGRFVSTCVLKSVPSPGQGLQEKPDSKKGSVQKCADPRGLVLSWLPLHKRRAPCLLKSSFLPGSGSSGSVPVSPSLLYTFNFFSLSGQFNSVVGAFLSVGSCCPSRYSVLSWTFSSLW